MHNILQNLNNLEISFIEYKGKSSDFMQYATYRQFMESIFIKKNKLSSIYWPQINTISPKFVSDINVIQEAFMIASDCNLAIVKQINFPVSVMHSAKYFNCIYIYQGSGILQLNKITFSLQVGDFFIVPPDVDYCLTTTPDDIAIHIMLRKAYVSSNYYQLFNNHPLITNFFNLVLTNATDNLNSYVLFHTKDNEAIRENILLLFSDYLWGDDNKSFIMECYLKLIFAYLLRNSNSTLEISATCSKIETHYQLIHNYLKKYYLTANLTNTSEYFHYSKQYICRIVKQFSGKTFTDILTEIRIEKAMEYMKETTLRLDNIAELTGFSDASHLSRIFKKNLGKSPSIYRTENK